MYLGNKLTETEYDGVGCAITEKLTDRVVNNTLLIGDSEVVVVLKGKYYGGVSTRGDELIPPIFDYICSITSGGENLYRLVYNGVDYDAIEYINLAKEKFGYPESDNQNDANNANSENTQGENSEGENAEGNTENNNQEVNNSGEGEQGGENTNTEPSENQGEANNATQNMENEAAKAFNAQFEAYNGERSKGTTKSLLDIVSSSNTLSEQKVTIEYEGNLYTDDVSGLKDALTNNTYNVSIEYDNESGYINKIIIK